MSIIAVAKATLDSRQILKPRPVNMHPFRLLLRRTLRELSSAFCPVPFAINVEQLITNSIPQIDYRFHSREDSSLSIGRLPLDSRVPKQFEPGDGEKERSIEFHPTV